MPGPDDSGVVFHPAYFEVRFRVPSPPGSWPDRFAVLTAWAPTGTTRSEAANRAADLDLRAMLVGTGVREPVRVTGYSPTTGHAEPGWTIPFDTPRHGGLSPDEVFRLARRFGQDALYLVDGDRLTVIGCRDATDDRVAEVGSFRDRLDPQVDPGADEPAHGDGLPVDIRVE